MNDVLSELTEKNHHHFCNVGTIMEKTVYGVALFLLDKDYILYCVFDFILEYNKIFHFCQEYAVSEIMKQIQVNVMLSFNFY